MSVTGLPSAVRRFFNSATPLRAAIAAANAALHACVRLSAVKMARVPSTAFASRIARPSSPVRSKLSLATFAQSSFSAGVIEGNTELFRKDLGKRCFVALAAGLGSRMESRSFNHKYFNAAVASSTNYTLRSRASSMHI